MDGKWVCTRCGDCCRNVTPFIPEFDRGDGVCRNLGSDNICSIYETRPMICRIPSHAEEYKAECCALVRNHFLQVRQAHAP